MSANERIQWLHKKISENSYPAIAHLTEKFSISRRQAQRDVDYMKKVLEAPIAYSTAHKGYYYTRPFSIPLLIQTENDADFHDVIFGLRSFESANAARAVIQLQLPYSATLEIKDQMTVLNLRSLIVADEPHHRYRCEFPSVELFLGIIISTGADIRIVEPEWLRTRLLDFAQRIIKNNDARAESEVKETHKSKGKAKK